MIDTGRRQTKVPLSAWTRWIMWGEGGEGERGGEGGGESGGGGGERGGGGGQRDFLVYIQKHHSIKKGKGV